MKAVVYRGPFKVAVEDGPRPADRSADRRGRAHHHHQHLRLGPAHVRGPHQRGGGQGPRPREHGRRRGDRAGRDRIKAGDRVSVPFNIACGTCRNCQDGWWSFCLRINPTEGVDGAAYGYANMGPYHGGQAEYLRVPFADVNLLELPAGTSTSSTSRMLSDIFPTGYHGAVLAGVSPGDTVVVFGAGPVGLHGRAQRLICAARPGVRGGQGGGPAALADTASAPAPVDISEGDPVEQILDATDGLGAPTAASRPSATRPTTRRRGAPRARARQPGQGRSGPPAGSASSASTCRRTPGRPARAPRRAGSAGTTARSSPRASAWAPGRPGQALQPSSCAT